MFKAFLDTNVLLYAQDPRDPAKQQVGRRLVQLHQSNGSGVVSTQVLQEFYVIVTKKFRQDSLIARRLVQDLEAFEVVTVTSLLIKNGIDISVLSGISFWDALIVAAAEAAHCNVLLTEDLSHGQMINAVRVENPFRAVSSEWGNG